MFLRNLFNSGKRNEKEARSPACDEISKCLHGQRNLHGMSSLQSHKLTRNRCITIYLFVF